ncbi:hypothetical protein M5K25_027324 [Dendrobium thyrsiflorum]|uniref:Uncharacterized protein n=1 Tax=Dendrobium thyrsiflorum TaxID=117978 RepID=A0ABD0TZW8_DENTH
MDDYVDRILFTLMSSIEEHLPIEHWRVIGRPPTSPPSALLQRTISLKGSFNLSLLVHKLVYHASLKQQLLRSTDLKDWDTREVVEGKSRRHSEDLKEIISVAISFFHSQGAINIQQYRKKK